MSILRAFRIGKIIQQELLEGARFESLKPPIPSLKNLNFIQFRKDIGEPGRAYGLAVSRNFKKAQIVSYFEYLDRKAFHENWKRLNLKSTNGVAAHKFRFLAVQAARNEVIERDAFLFHWHSQIPFLPIQGNSLSEQIAEDLKPSKFSLHLCQTTLGLNPVIVCLLINEATGGFCVGSSAGKGRESDIEKACVEAVINLYFGNYGKNTEDLVRDLELNGITDLEGHRTLWLYKSAAPDWLFSKIPNQFDVQHLKVDFRVLDLSSDPFPVVAVQAPQMFQLLIGMPPDGELKKLTQRLKDYNSKGQGAPHPLF